MKREEVQTGEADAHSDGIRVVVYRHQWPIHDGWMDGLCTIGKASKAR
jgi:hypothetical protein